MASFTSHSTSHTVPHNPWEEPQGVQREYPSMIYQVTDSPAHGYALPDEIWILTKMTHITVMPHIPGPQDKIHNPICLIIIP